MKSLLLVGAGGFIGSIARYSISLLIVRVQIEKAYLGTLSVNLIGCFLIGLLSGYMAKLSQHHTLLLITGFCGGFTTFSSFALDGLKLIKEGMYVQLLVYLTFSLVGGLALCIGGFYLVSKT